MQFTPYLYFKGDCEAALEFYAACGLGSIRDLRRYEGTPMEGRDGGAWARQGPAFVLRGTVASPLRVGRSRL